MNILGQIIQAKTTQDDIVSFSITGLSPSIYFATIHIDDLDVSIKFIVSE